MVPWSMRRVQPQPQNQKNHCGYILSANVPGAKGQIHTMFRNISTVAAYGTDGHAIREGISQLARGRSISGTG